jgi:hypothetical protein
MEKPRDPVELVIGLREDVVGVRTTVGHLSSDVSEVKQDVRRLDDRLFQLMSLQLGTLATSLAALVAALIS